MKLRFCKWSVVFSLFVLGTALRAQAPEPNPPVKPPKAFNIGLRVRALPLRDFSVMGNGSNMTTIPGSGTTPSRDWSFVTTTHSSRVGFGGGIEYNPSSRWSISVEALTNKLSFTKVTTIASGTDDPATPNDERVRSYLSEDTRGKIWDFPVLVRYHGLAQSGALSKAFVTGGVALRAVTGLKSQTKITNADASTSVNNILVPPSKRNVLGAVAGIGFRTIDDFRINWIPEIRYTRWTGSTFALQSTMSPRNQLELSIGMMF